MKRDHFTVIGMLVSSKTIYARHLSRLIITDRLYRFVCHMNVDLSKIVQVAASTGNFVSISLWPLAVIELKFWKIGFVIIAIMLSIFLSSRFMKRFLILKYENPISHLENIKKQKKIRKKRPIIENTINAQKSMHTHEKPNILKLSIYILSSCHHLALGSKRVKPAKRLIFFFNQI